jgi:signal transduction histidine kinase
VGHRRHRPRRQRLHPDPAARHLRLLTHQPADRPRRARGAGAGAQPALLRRRPGIAALLAPTKRTISGSLERLHYRGSFGKRRALTEFGQELLHERDLGSLCAALLKQLEDGLELERANLLLAQGERLEPARPEPSLPEPLGLDAFGPGFWQGEIEMLSGVALPDGSPPPAQRLFAAGYRYAFPLVVRGARVGVALAGFKHEGSPLNSEDVELARGLLNQAALAIENAQLVDQLARQLAETVRLQQHNEGIIESSPAGIAVLDGEDRVTSSNAAFAALAGISREQALGRPLKDFLPVQPLPQPGGGLAEVAFCDASGNEHHLQLGVALLDRGPHGGEPLRVLVVQDVSDRVAMENALRESDRLAALGMLAAGVAHEVNTPITGISSYAQMLLAETPEQDPRYDLLKKVERQTFRAARIVNSLLEFARNRQSERQPVALGALVAECAELLRERLAERRIQLEWERPAPDVAVPGNDGELQQVLTNLMLNAVDAMAERGGRLRLRLTADGDHARIEVEDDGPGIPPALVGKVFQPFFSTKLAQGGTGLGLSISYNIVRRHGGDLRVENSPGKGCRFIVELPRAPDPGDETSSAS